MDDWNTTVRLVVFQSYPCLIAHLPILMNAIELVPHDISVFLIASCRSRSTRIKVRHDCTDSETRACWRESIEVKQLQGSQMACMQSKSSAIPYEYLFHTRGMRSWLCLKVSVVTQHLRLWYNNPISCHFLVLSYSSFSFFLIHPCVLQANTLRGVKSLYTKQKSRKKDPSATLENTVSVRSFLHDTGSVPKNCMFIEQA